MMVLLLLFIASAMSLSSEGNISFRGSKYLLEAYSSFILSSIIKESEGVQLSDLKAKQRSEFTRLQASFFSIKATDIDFSNAKVKVDLIVPSSEDVTCFKEESVIKL